LESFIAEAKVVTGTSKKLLVKPIPALKSELAYPLGPCFEKLYYEGFINIPYYFPSIKILSVARLLLSIIIYPWTVILIKEISLISII
jgi:hypothetical protein